jgi:hypothetical protein
MRVEIFVSAVVPTFSHCFACCNVYLIAIQFHVLYIIDLIGLFLQIAQLYFSTQSATLGSQLNYLTNNALKTWRYYERN